jgi:hypothetical protein
LIARTKPVRLHGAPVFLVLSLVLLVTSACIPTPPGTATGPRTSGAAVSPAVGPAGKVVAPEPKSGLGSLAGTFVQRRATSSAANLGFYLTRGEGPEGREIPPILFGPQREGDIPAMTDGAGNFAINDIPPGTYFIVLVGGFDWIPVEEGSPPRPKAVEIRANQRVQLGDVILP